MPNFNSLAGLEMAEKFVGDGGFQVTTASNSNASCFIVALSLVELRWVLTTIRQNSLISFVENDHDHALPFLDNVRNFVDFLGNHIVLVIEYDLFKQPAVLVNNSE